MTEKFKATRTRSTPFTDPIVDKAKPEGKPFEVAEPGGLRLTVGKLSKTWTFRYKEPETGRARKMTLGKYPAMGLSDARVALANARHQLSLGVDPGLIKAAGQQARREAPTFDEVVEEYVLRRASRKRSGGEDERSLRKNASPRFGALKVFSVKRADVLGMVDEIVDRGSPIAAARALGFVRMVFDFAIERGYIEHNPCYRIKPPAVAQQRDRVLSDDEIRTVWAMVSGFDRAPAVSAILQLCLVTGQRIGEIRRMRWGDIDGAWWTIPKEHSKNKRAHGVYLSPMACDILAEQKSQGGTFVFPGTDPHTELDRNTPDRHWRRHRDQAGFGGIRIHDFRRTVATKMTEIGVNRLVVSKVLNHSDRGVTAIYDRHSYRPEIQTALIEWACYLKAILAKSGEVK